MKHHRYKDIDIWEGPSKPLTPEQTKNMAEQIAKRSAEINRDLRAALKLPKKDQASQKHGGIDHA